MEFSADPSLPDGFAKYLKSVNLEESGCFHAFEASGECFEDYAWSTGVTSFSDEERLKMIVDLLGVVDYLHDLGLPHPA